MAQTVIMSPEVGDAATIDTVGSEAATMPATNLQTMQPTSVWRATDVNNAYIEVQLDRVRPIDGIALLYHNLSADGAIRVRGASTQANLTANPAYDSGPKPARSFQDSITLIWSDESDNPENKAYDRNHFILVPSEQTYEWWRIDCYDANNGDGYIQAGRLYLSNSYRPTRNIRYDWGVGWNDGQQRVEARGGQTFTRQRDTKRRLEASIQLQDETELWENLFQIQRKRGTAKDVLVVVDKDNTARLQDWSVYGTMVDLDQIVNRSFNLYRLNMTIEELI